MSDYKPGDILYVRVTSEPTAFIRFAEGRTDAVLVRRPIETKDGLHHEAELWPLAELETFEEGLKRRWADRKLQDFLRQQLESQEAAPPDPEVLQ